jgi:hypothetical protein
MFVSCNNKCENSLENDRCLTTKNTSEKIYEFFIFVNRFQDERNGRIVSLDETTHIEESLNL